MNSWQTLCTHIRENELFTTKEVRALIPKSLVVYNYLLWLKKAQYIEKIKKGYYKRIKSIPEMSIYRCQQIGYDLE